MPPRLSYAQGEASLWRPGTQHWAPVQVNTPLEAGDELSTGREGHLEVQVGTRAGVRAWGDTPLGLTNQQPTFRQARAIAGRPPSTWAALARLAGLGAAFWTRRE